MGAGFMGRPTKPVTPTDIPVVEAVIHLPGDKVRANWPGLHGIVGTIFDAKPSDLDGFDFAVQFGPISVLMYAAEVVAA